MARRISLPKHNLKIMRVQQLTQDEKSTAIVKKPLKTAHFELEFLDEGKYEAWLKHVASLYLQILKKRKASKSVKRQSEVC